MGIRFEGGGWSKRTERGREDEEGGGGLIVMIRGRELHGLILSFIPVR